MSSDRPSIDIHSASRRKPDDDTDRFVVEKFLAACGRTEGDKKKQA
jgi:hypothetical protein